MFTIQKDEGILTSIFQVCVGGGLKRKSDTELRGKTEPHSPNFSTSKNLRKCKGLNNSTNSTF